MEVNAIHLSKNMCTFALYEDAEPQPMIIAFRGDNFFLSNLAPCQVTLPAADGLPAMAFDSTEKAYMAWKTLDQSVREKIAGMDSKEAKKLSHQEGFPLREPYTDEGRLAIMKELVSQKFSDRNPELKEKLLATDEATLMEGNTWGDTFFGFDLKKGCGQNHLGRLIMERRTEFQAAAQDAA